MKLRYRHTVGCQGSKGCHAFRCIPFAPFEIDGTLLVNYRLQRFAVSAPLRVFFRVGLVVLLQCGYMQQVELLTVLCCPKLVAKTVASGP